MKPQYHTRTAVSELGSKVKSTCCTHIQNQLIWMCVQRVEHQKNTIHTLRTEAVAKAHRNDGGATEGREHLPIYGLRRTGQRCQVQMLINHNVRCLLEKSISESLGCGNSCDFAISCLCQCTCHPFFLPHKQQEPQAYARPAGVAHTKCCMHP